MKKTNIVFVEFTKGRVRKISKERYNHIKEKYISFCGKPFEVKTFIKRLQQERTVFITEELTNIINGWNK